MRAFPKKIYREIKQSSQIKVGQDSPVNGFGYTIIPIDVSRKDYLKLVYQTGYVMLVSSDHEIYRDVKVPNHLIDDLTFPEKAGQYGNLVSWSIAKQHNQLFVTGVYTKPGQFHPYLENVAVHKFPSKSHEITVSADGNAPSYVVTVYNGIDNSGGIQLKSHSRSGSSSFSLNADGTGELTIDDTFKTTIEKRLEVNLGLDIKLVVETGTGLTYTDGEAVELVIEKDLGLTYKDAFENELAIVETGLTYKDAFGNVLTVIDGEISIVDDLNNSISLKEGEMAITSDSVNVVDKQIVINDETVTIAKGVVIDGQAVSIAQTLAVAGAMSAAGGFTAGTGTNPLVLGNELVTILTNLITQISLLTVICSSPGSPSSPPVNAGAISQLTSQLQQFLSETSFTE